MFLSDTDLLNQWFHSEPCQVLVTNQKKHWTITSTWLLSFPALKFIVNSHCLDLRWDHPILSIFGEHVSRCPPQKNRPFQKRVADVQTNLNRRSTLNIWLRVSGIRNDWIIVPTPRLQNPLQLREFFCKKEKLTNMKTTAENLPAALLAGKAVCSHSSWNFWSFVVDFWIPQQRLSPWLCGGLGQRWPVGRLARQGFLDSGPGFKIHCIIFICKYTYRDDTAIFVVLEVFVFKEQLEVFWKVTWKLKRLAVSCLKIFGKSISQ